MEETNYGGDAKGAEMSIDSEVGEVAAKFLDRIDGMYGDEARVELAALVVAIDKGDGTTDYHHVFGPKNASAHESLGLLDNASHNVRKLSDRSSGF